MIEELSNGGSKFVITDFTYLEKYHKLNPEIRKYISAFTDKEKGSTLSKFLDECDNPGFRQSVNENPILAEAFVGHKNKWTKGDYEALADEIDLLTTDPELQELISKWMNRSGKISDFDKVAELGRSLGKKIVNDLINNKQGSIMKALSEQTKISLEELARYDVLSEVPLETVGGFMKADAVLIKRNVRGFVDYKKYFPTTVIDQSIVVPKPRPFWIETIEDLEYFTNCIVDYLENSGKEFIEKYSYLPNILKRMDELQAEGKYWQDKECGILSGSLDAEYRGLIISKLCNDPKFRDKLELCDEVFRDEIYSNWLPGYEKLKEILQTVEPIYNV
ncbi:hypothetical protein HX038_15360 [Myroides odoratimimus]|uniref:hypothetical protein n=1 Tax=Myroides odoratimimus TaxID=76832 RepID=UPI002575E999|nr:hypothetical protein [Myroides odoratimimus]MDM1412113.1 hypothetical protein [Myroides odoratimimus]